MAGLMMCMVGDVAVELQVIVGKDLEDLEIDD